jgi:hypothetical protein
MDLAIIRVSTKPEAPTKHPATIKAVFVKSTPADAAAIPERELRSDITTGISPPPIGVTNAKPAIIETTKTAMNTFWISSKSKIYIPELLETICNAAIAIKIKLKIKNHLDALFKKLFEALNISESLRNAITLPLNVMPPIITVA